MPRRAYHHGDLRRSLLRAAVDLIAERGVEAVSLRELARRAEVSHAAPAHHFTDKAGLFTALAVEGHRMLAESFRDAAEAPVPSGLREMGVRYVRFALDHPAHFEVMFRPDLYRSEDPELREAQDRTRTLLRGALPGGPQGPQVRAQVLAAWSAAHGFAALWREGSLTALLGDTTPEEAFGEAADAMFRAPGG